MKHAFLVTLATVVFALSGEMPLRAETDPTHRIGELEQKVKDYERLKEEAENLKAAAERVRDRESAPVELRIGRRTATVRGLLQIWSLHSELAPDEIRLRRSETNLKGWITEWFGYTVMIDPAKTLSENKTILVGTEAVTLSQPKSDAKILQDLFITLKLFPYHEIHVGQNKIPLSLEGEGSSARLDFAERAIVSGASFQGQRGFGDFREPGIQVAGDWPFVSYTVGVFNGEGPNASEKNDRKDLGERVILRPVPWLHVGVSRYDGWLGPEKARKNRTGTEFALIYDPVFLKGEYIRAHDGPIAKDGWYVSTGYRIAGLRIGPIRFDVQPAARWESFDPDRDVDDNAISGPTIGANLFFDDYHAKIQLDYTHFDVPGSKDEDMAIAAFQVAS